MHKVSQEISDKHMSSVLKKFYRVTLRKGEDIIDNSDATIAKELGIQVWIVARILVEHLDDKYNRETS